MHIATNKARHMRRTKTTLCIIGGGGCAQLESAAGVLQALDKADIHITRYMASGAGSVAAALHASGLPGEQIGQFIRNTPVDKLFYRKVFCTIMRFLVDPGIQVFTGTGLSKKLSALLTSDARRRVSVHTTEGATPATAKSILAAHDFYPNELSLPLPFLPSLHPQNYKHIYIILCPPSSGCSTAYLRELQKEAQGVHEQGWPDMANVTVIQPPAYSLRLSRWSQGNGLIDHAKQYTEQILKGIDI